MSEKISSLGCYSGYNDASYDGYNLYSRYVKLKNGLKLAMDYYIPTKGGIETKEKLPCILLYTPYGRRVYSKTPAADGTRTTSVNERSFDLPSFTKYGYCCAVVESRGTGASFGVRVTVNSREEAADGAEMVEWIASQPWCDGHVGTVGSSYKGQTQLELLSMTPRHLTACFIGCTDYNKYDGWVRNGVPRAFGSQPDVFWGDTPEEIQASIDRVVANTVPVDDDPDKVELRKAITEHTRSGLQIPMLRDLNWRNSWLEDYHAEVWNKVSASTNKEAINATNAAIYVVGGTFDVFRRDTFIIYHNLTCPKKLLLGPWYHTVAKLDPEWNVEIRRWMDYWMKGIDNGIMNEKPFSLRVANYNFPAETYLGEATGFYRFEDRWPLHEGRRTTFYASAAAPESGSDLDNGVLANVPAAESSMEYKTVYGITTSKESRYTVDDKGMGVDQKGLSFATSPLKEDVTFIGHPMAHVAFKVTDPGWMSEDRLDTDVFITLSDYDPATGLSFEIGDGHLRTSLRKAEECPLYDFLGLPWHENNIGDNEYLKAGTRYDVDFDLMPISYCLKAGHCLRMTLSNSVDRMYYHGRLAFEADHDVKTPVLEFICGGEDGTKLILPNIYEK